MSTFLNFNIGEPTPKNFVYKHFLFSFIWVLGLFLLIFRVDVHIINSFGERYEWVVGFIPIAFFVLVVLIFSLQRWFYSIALVLYPLLALFWFIPKVILAQGKIYLFGQYITFIFKRIIKFKSTLIYSVLFFLALILILLTSSPYIKIGAIILMTYFYIIYIINYITQSLRPIHLFGTNIEDIFLQLKSDDKKKYSLINSIENQQTEINLPEEERKLKQLSRLIMFNYTLEFISKNLNGFKGKKAYIISWTSQLIMFLLITLIFFTFINTQLFLINSSFYKVIGDPTLFDFFYYTVKNITFSEIETIKPASIITKLIEMVTFFVLGIFLLIIVASVLFSLKQDKINENIKQTTEMCHIQNQLIVEHIKVQYGTDIESTLKEVKSIKTSIDNLKKVIGKLF